MLFFQEVWSVSLALSPWLFFGAVVSALLHKWLPSDFIKKQLTGYSGIIKAVFLGVPLPLCSCGVIPAGIGLKKDGASDGSSIAFLISTPQTGIDSVFISAAFLGWPFAILKVFAATTTGILGGFISENASPPVTKNTKIKKSEKREVTWQDAWQHGVQLIRSIWGWLLVGILLSAAITTLVPDEFITSVPEGWMSLIVAIIISLPLYVCATASVPIAAALVTAGLPLNAALVFLMAGPASNLATIGAIYKTFGKKNSVIYLGTILLGSLFFAMTFDFVLSDTSSSSFHEHHQTWQIPFSILLFVSLTYFAWEEYSPLLKPKKESKENMHNMQIWVQGLTCGGCVRKLESRLLQHHQVEEVQIALDDGKTIIHGPVSIHDIEKIIDDLQYTILYPSLTYTIIGLHCGGCVRKLESSLRTIDGVDSVSVQIEPDIAQLTGMLSQKLITNKIEDMGYSLIRVHKNGY